MAAEQVLKSGSMRVTLQRMKTSLDSARSARFESAALERGAGEALGAALRQALLHQVPGGAVTAVRAELDGLPAPVGWMQPLQQSLAQVALDLGARAPNPLQTRLDVPPNTIVTAAALERPGVRVIDPEYEICATHSSGLTLDLWLERGSGMRLGANAGPLPEGAAPVDAFFGPVSRADFWVNRSAERHFEQLVLELETNGAMTPQATLWKAALHLSPEWDLDLSE